MAKLTQRQAIMKILKEAKKPLTYEQVAQKVEESKIWNSKAKNPKSKNDSYAGRLNELEAEEKIKTKTIEKRIHYYV